jgi:hypothetical protein
VLEALESGRFVQTSELDRDDRLDLMTKMDELSQALVSSAQQVAKLVDWMTSLGFTPPSLPPRLIDALREGGILEVASPGELLTDTDEVSK